MTKVVIAGSRALPTGLAPQVLGVFLANLEPGSTILLRAGGKSIGEFEQQVADLADAIGLLDVEYRAPDTTSISGRRSVWYRDCDMLASSELCLAFVTNDQLGDDESGTWGLIDKAMGMDVPVYGYVVHTTKTGPTVVLAGEHDPENLWSELVP
jgi:hypothetical protein